MKMKLNGWWSGWKNQSVISEESRGPFWMHKLFEVSKGDNPNESTEFTKISFLLKTTSKHIIQKWEIILNGFL